MNSEDIYSSLKGVTEAIQNFSVRSQEDMNDPVQRREGEEVSGAKRLRLSGTESGSVPLGTTCLQTRAGHHRIFFFSVMNFFFFPFHEFSLSSDLHRVTKLGKDSYF